MSDDIVGIVNDNVEIIGKSGDVDIIGVINDNVEIIGKSGDVDIIGVINDNVQIIGNIMGVGPRGIPGPISQTYVYEQMVPSKVWVINHNMEKYPSVFVQDSAGNDTIGEVEYLTSMQLSITFSYDFAGIAYLN